jgi:formylglycine-generating enzyme required for sulfatase activity
MHNPFEFYAALWCKRKSPNEEANLLVGEVDGDGYRNRSSECQIKGYSRWIHQAMLDADGRCRFSEVWRSSPQPIVIAKGRKRGDRQIWPELPQQPLSVRDTTLQAIRAVQAAGRFQTDVSVRPGGGAKEDKLETRSPKGPLYSGLWWPQEGATPPWETRLIAGLAPVQHREQCAILAAEGYRPEAISVAWLGKEKSLATASVWRRPAMAEERVDVWAHQQANRAATLIRLGMAERVWPLLRQTANPTLRTWLIHQLIPLGTKPGDLIAHLQDPQIEISQRRALVQCLGDVDPNELPADIRDRLEAWLLTEYRTHPDAGYHSSVGWLLRRWQGEATLREAEEALASRDPILDRRWYVNRQGQTFAVVPGNAPFWMGSPTFEPGHDPSEGALQLHAIPYSFAVATTEVTNEQYARFYESRYGKHDLTGFSPGETTPALLLSWRDAVEYCQWLSQEEGIDESEWCYPPLKVLLGYRKTPPGAPVSADIKRTGYRLPTEAEWECACRAGTLTSRAYGTSLALLTKYAAYRGTIQHPGNAEEAAQHVGLLKPNDFGLFDMYGNAWEWCDDRYSQPRPRFASTNRVLRGGAFNSQPKDLRSAARFYAPEDQVINMSGFRVVRTLPEKGERRQE